MAAGEILKNIWIKLGFKNKTQFARSLDRRVEIIDYAIKHNKISNTLEMLIVTKHPVNREYLQTGEGPILKARINYERCLQCQLKENQIEHLLDEIYHFKKYIVMLEKENHELKERINRAVS